MKFLQLAARPLLQRALFILGLFSLLLAPASVGLSKDRNKEKNQDSGIIKNFGRVNDHLYRGAQPEGNDYRQLARLGVKTVIDLRNDAERWASSLSQDAGLRYVNLPLDSRRPPTVEEANQFLSIVNDQTNWPVYVHCAGGRHRTGVMVAIYRMEADGWDARAAYEEMKDFKFYSNWGHGEMKDCVFDYYRGLANRRAQAAQAAPTVRARRVTEGGR